MKKFGILLILSFGLSACNSNGTGELFIKSYTVIWQNYDGTILEKDTGLKEGEFPTYDGITPTREGTSNYHFEFKGWTPEIVKVSHNTTYTATFNKVTETDKEEYKPFLSDDEKTITYGLYPQSVIKDENIIASLETSSPTDINGWYYLNNEYFVKQSASVYNNESYTFNDGSAIVNGTEYWYKCEPITWNVLNKENGKYLLISSILLDNQQFYSDYNKRTFDGEVILPNNYKESNIRNWLNDTFYNKAFALNNSFITNANIDGLTDKVFLPSKEDVLNTQYGFEDNEESKSKTRECLTSEYTRSIGSWASKESAYKNNGTYWTSSPSNEFEYASKVVNAGGYISDYVVDGISNSVRPCIIIEL